MLVGAAYPERSAASSDSLTLSAGRPDFSSVMATRERQVSEAHVRTRAVSTAYTALPRDRAGALRGAGAEAEPRAARTVAAAPAAPPIRSWRREGAEVRRVMTSSDHLMPVVAMPS